MTDLSIDTETRVHLQETAPKSIFIHNREGNDELGLSARSFLTVTYGTEYSSDSSVTLFLDYASAKALAEGILEKVEKLKYGKPEVVEYREGGE